MAVQYACAGAEPPSRPRLRRWVNRALEPAAGSAQITLRFVDAEESRTLNRQFRGKDSATNVLSFPYAPPPELAGKSPGGDRMTQFHVVRVFVGTRDTGETRC